MIQEQWVFFSLNNICNADIVVIRKSDDCIVK